VPRLLVEQVGEQTDGAVVPSPVDIVQRVPVRVARAVEPLEGRRDAHEPERVELGTLRRSDRALEERNALV
jgi:hypothetical protein